MRGKESSLGASDGEGKSGYRVALRSNSQIGRTVLWIGGLKGSLGKSSGEEVALRRDVYGLGEVRSTSQREPLERTKTGRFRSALW